MPSFAQELGDAKQQFGALFGRRPRPTLERLVGRFDRAPRQFLSRLLKAPDHLGLARRVHAIKRAPGLDALAADHQRVLAAQFAPHLIERRAHRRRVLFLAEVRQRFVLKFALHDRSSYAYVVKHKLMA